MAMIMPSITVKVRFRSSDSGISASIGDSSEVRAGSATNPVSRVVIVMPSWALER